MPFANRKIFCLFVSKSMKIRERHIFKSKTAPQPGSLLLADPHLTEDFFQRAAILLVAHDAHESFGLVLNHPTELALSDLFDHIELDLPIYNGGPVAPEQLFYLHRFANIKGATRVTEQLYFGGDWQEVLTNAIVLKKPENHLRLFAGYAGWGAKQLSEELQDFAWICTTDFEDQSILKVDPAVLWKKSMLEQGPKLAMFAHFPLNASDN
jgi:putative transcriptional regulator